MNSGEENSTVELTDVESFHYFMRCLWDKDHMKKEHMVILDTLIYKNGRPYRWLFTNNDGCVMKKRDENLHAREIIRVFKSRSKAMQSGKHHEMSGKIAVVWYVDDVNGIRSYFVDDIQLRSFLEEPVYECLAIQLYIGGFPLKASGVFEHRFWVRSNGTTGSSTAELISAAGANVTIYTEGVERLTINDYQHDALKTVAKRIVKMIEKNMRGTVANIVLQFAFSKSWNPFVVGARSMLFWNPDNKITTYRAANLYVCEPPVPPSSGQRGSHLLPAMHLDPDKHTHMGMPLTLPARVMKTPHGKQLEGIDSITGENLFDVIENAPNTEFKQKLSRQRGENVTDEKGDPVESENLEVSLHKHLHEFGDEVELEHGNHIKFGEVNELKTPAHENNEHRGHIHHQAIMAPTTDDSGMGPGGFMTGKEQVNEVGISKPVTDKHPVTGSYHRRAVSKYNDADLLFMDSKKLSTQKGANSRFLNGEGLRPLGASDRGPHYPEGLGEGGQTLGEKSEAKAVSSTPAYQEDMENAYDPLARRKDSTITTDLRKQSMVMTRLAKPHRGDPESSNNVTLKRLKTVLPGQGKGAIYRNAAYAQTESSRTRLEFYANQLRVAETLPIDKMLKHRRAISAPHGPRRGRANIPLDGPNAHINSAMMASGKLATKAAVGFAVGATQTALGRHGVSAGGRRSSGFERPVPLQSGTVCYGDYCFLAETAGGAGSGQDESKSTKPDIRTLLEAEESSPTNEMGNDGTENSVKVAPEQLDIREDGGGGPQSMNKYDKNSGATRQHGDKLDPKTLQPPILPYQLPFRSVLLLRSEENHLDCKLYEQWKFDDSIMESKAVLESREKEYKFMDHNKRLLNLTQRHLRRIAYTCLHDVKRTVISMPTPHSSGSGFTHQWEQLSMSYRKLVYADALSKTHPSRFYQTVPMCDTCQYIYSMADMFRDEIVFGGVRSADKMSPNKSPSRPTATRGSPIKTNQMFLEEARAKGRMKREEADSYGSFKSREYGSPRRPGKTTMRVLAMKGKVSSHQRLDDAFHASLGSHSDDPDIYDVIFDSHVPSGNEAVQSAIKQDAEIALLNAMDLRYAEQLKEENQKGKKGLVDDDDEESIGPDGKQKPIGSWVRMLTEPADAVVRSETAEAKPGKAFRIRTDDSGKPNPMGPLAGQGVGSPLGQYRGLAAPTGYMLGSAAGDVGTRVIDEKGNFIYQKKRSPAERFGSSTDANAKEKDIAAVTSNPDFYPEAQSGAVDAGGPLYRGEDGIAFRSTHKQQSKRHLSSAGRTESRKGSGRLGDGFTESKHSGGDVLINIDQYQFKSVQASQLKAQMAQGKARPKSAAAAAPVRPISLPDNHHAADPKNMGGLEEYQFNSLPGGDAPLIPLTYMHQSHLQKAASTNELTTLPQYNSGGTSFETMILDTHNASEAYKKAQKLYSKRRPASGPAAGRMSGRRREIFEERERKKQEQEEIAARGYLGGLDMGAHTVHVKNTYSKTVEKLKLGKQNPSKNVSDK